MTTPRGALLVVALTLLAAGCGGNDNSSKRNAAAPTDTPTTAAPAATATSTPAAGATSTPAAATSTPTATATATPVPDKTPAPDHSAPATSTTASCAGKDTGTMQVKPPDDLVVPGEAHLYRSQGAKANTTFFDAVTDGPPSQVSYVRDNALGFLNDVGYTALSTAEKGQTRATAHLQGPKHLMNIVVTPLCKDKINIHYTLY